MSIVQWFGGDYKNFDGSVECEGVWVLPTLCPFCDCKGLKLHAYYWRKWSECNSTCHQVKIPLMQCSKCKKYMAVLPHFLAPYQRIVTAMREKLVRLWTEGISKKALTAMFNLSLSTVRRWITKAINKAPQIIQVVSRLCHEFKPELPPPIHTLPVSINERTMVGLAMYHSDTLRKLTSQSICSWAVVNIQQLESIKNTELHQQSKWNRSLWW
jgi:hypothetical protein